MAHYLITGGCGFIGSHLADRLLADGHRVTILDNLSSGRLENKPSAAKLVVGDVADPDAVREAMAGDAGEGVDGVFHLAAVASVQKSRELWAETHRTNLLGTVTVFEAARDAKRGGPIPVVYASSAAIYGDNGNTPLNEDELPRPLSAYGVDKLGCEMHARVAWAIQGVPTVGFRFFNVYGPRQDPMSPYSGVISIFARRVARGEDVEIHGDGQQVRDFVFVGDVVRILTLAMERRFAGAQVYNLCTGRATSLVMLLEVLQELCGSKVRRRHTEARAGDIRVSIGDPSLLRSTFDTVCQVGLLQGLSATLTGRMP
ncbi:SDR family NAD(P)-dependent oxidoreductase [Azospirillum melinis]|uniref:SDR family NAD(P)-dependent oxidoreductase n=1 Tax=Azospirillum melinis TaxID=328839 RepID=A0ABX2K5C1_9PROT|nr:SDR family NAD(P)-dependent oxidoreductase [Azospirillum melinis]MBP2306732.1 UDP-glucose 4-epimerase [Azospirillum melinis]NUA98759.1 SDR family NAD(P)-dependent oxidoreductase [Azospirillum melinis]